MLVCFLFISERARNKRNSRKFKDNKASEKNKNRHKYLKAHSHDVRLTGAAEGCSAKNRNFLSLPREHSLTL